MPEILKRPEAVAPRLESFCPKCGTLAQRFFSNPHDIEVLINKKREVIVELNCQLCAKTFVIVIPTGNKPDVKADPARKATKADGQSAKLATKKEHRIVKPKTAGKRKVVQDVETKKIKVN